MQQLVNGYAGQGKDDYSQYRVHEYVSEGEVAPDIDPDKLQIRKLDASTVIELSESGVQIDTDQDLIANVSGDATINADNIDLTATNNLDLNADIINLTCNVLNINAGVINGL